MYSRITLDGITMSQIKSKIALKRTSSVFVVVVVVVLVVAVVFVFVE